MKDVDRRITDESEVRMDGGNDDEKIVGYAAVFNSFSQPIFGFRETIKPGAFKKTIRESDVRALINHDPNYVLGRTSSRTLRLSEDEKGLRYIVTPPDTTFARDLVVSIKRGDITQSSFGFSVVKDHWTGESPNMTRELLEVKLFDVSSVTYPAYLQTEVSVRSLLGYLSETKMKQDLGTEEKRAIAQVIENLRTRYHTEPDTRHSDAGSQEPDAAAQAALHSQDVLRRTQIRKRLELFLVG